MQRTHLTILILLFSTPLFSQDIQPWWLKNPVVDSSDIKRLQLADSILQYAITFMHVPYVWGGNNPVSGFDCSGFVSYVYKNFGIDLPRTSIEQFNAGYPIPYTMAEKGDLILFTGTDIKFGNPGHVGIIISKDENGFTFIHTSSTSSGGVRISHTEQEHYFYWRFLEIRRVIIR